jgi:hypothetical protein
MEKMDATAVRLSKEDKTLMETDVSHVEEYLETMEDDIVIAPMVPGTYDTAATLLWPKAVYPDMHGKTLNQGEMDYQAMCYYSAKSYTFLKAYKSTYASSMYNLLFEP